MADHFVWGMYKFDITSLAGETVELAEFNWYLDSENLGANDMGVQCYRAISSNGTDDQDWTTSDGITKLYDDICEYTRSNSTRLDRIVFSQGATLGYYAWDVAAGLQSAIDDGEDFFTCLMTRDTTQNSGTKTKDGAADTIGSINRGGSETERVNFRTSDFAGTDTDPFLDVLVQAKLQFPFIANAGHLMRQG